MKYLSVCSGIEAATVAWHGFGWEPVGFSEIEPFPSAVLKHRFPGVKNYGDMTKYKEWNIEPGKFDILVGGTPCQSFSIAGLRKGLDDPRGNLMLTYGAIADHFKPRWIVWENVPGVLSSNGGRDFGTFLGMLAKLGYGFAYRILDAQYVRTQSHPRAVPQRRRRVFVVGYLGDWRRAASVLLESESLRGYSPPSRKTGERVAPCVTNGPQFSRTGNERVEAEAMIPVKQPYQVGSWPKNVASCLNASFGDKQGLKDQHINQGAPLFTLAIQTGHTGANGSNLSVEVSPTLDISQPAAVAFAQNSRDELREMDVAGALAAQPGMKQQSFLRKGYRVRRLTPKECARLQGFPDDWAKIPWRGKAADQCPDGPQYKAYGNSMAVNCMNWIGGRINEIV